MKPLALNSSMQTLQLSANSAHTTAQFSVCMLLLYQDINFLTLPYEHTDMEKKKNSLAAGL